MCYVNLNNLFKLEYVHNITFLLILKQSKSKDVSEYLLRSGCTLGNLNDLKEQGYVKFIKGKKDQTQFQKARLDKKGTEFLNSLDEPEVLEEDKQFANWLVGLYKEKGKVIKSQKKLLKLIAWFRETTGINRNKLGYLLKCYIEEQEKTDFKYSHDVNNVFWVREHLYQTKPTLDNSRLYSFYLLNKHKFDKEFEKF